MDNHYNHKDVIKAVVDEIGQGKILGVVKNGAEWRISCGDEVSIQRLVECGIGIGGEDIQVRLINRNIVTVSFFGVPYYIGNEELRGKLEEFGVKQLSNWTRKCYEEYPEIENGTVYCRVEIPPNVKSLPYATRIDNVNVQIKHNGQSKVCNLCLSDEHLMRSCQRRLRCFLCGLVGHLRHDCPDGEKSPAVSDSGDESSGGESSESLFSDQASLASSSELVIDESKVSEPSVPEQSPSAEPVHDNIATAAPPLTAPEERQTNSSQDPPSKAEKHPHQSTDEDSWQVQGRKAKKREIVSLVQDPVANYNRFDVLNNDAGDEDHMEQSEQST